MQLVGRIQLNTVATNCNTNYKYTALSVRVPRCQKLQMTA